MRFSSSLSAVLLSLVARVVVGTDFTGASSTSAFRSANNKKETNPGSSTLIANDGIRRGHSRHHVVEGEAPTNKHRHLQKEDKEDKDAEIEPTVQPTLVVTAIREGDDSNTTETTMPGSDRDDNGCIPSAGYQWCSSLAECIRPWETDCPISMPELLCSQSGGTVVKSQVCIGTGDFPQECVWTVEDDAAPTMMPKEPTAMPTVVVADTTSPTSTMTEADPPTADATDPDFVPDTDTMTPTMDSSAETTSPTIGEFIVDQPTAETVEPSPDLALEEPTSEPEVSSSVEPTATPTPTVASGRRRELQDDETKEATFGPTAEEPAVTFEPTSETSTDPPTDIVEDAGMEPTDAPTDVAEDAGLEPTGSPTDVAEENGAEPTAGPTDVAEEDTLVSDPPVAAPTVVEDGADGPSWSSCPPEESEEANICQCPSGTCFDPELGCVSTGEETKEPTSMPSTGEPTDMPTFVLTGEGSELGEGDGSRELPTSGGLGNIKMFTCILTGVVGIVVILCGEIIYI